MTALEAPLEEVARAALVLDPGSPILRYLKTWPAAARALAKVESELLFRRHAGLPTGVLEGLVAERVGRSPRTIRRWRSAALGLLLLAVVAPASAQQAIPPTCGAPRHTVTVVGTSAVSVPATALERRRWLTLRVSPENSGSPKVKCRLDGSNPTMGVANAGDVLAVGESITYGFAQGAPAVKCISDTAGTTVTVLECVLAP